MWDDAFPSFLIGLREGLEAGLIVSILIASLVRGGAANRLPQVWTGVLAAIAMSMSFGAILTFTAANLSTSAQEAFGGTLSVVAVAFVTAMVFWMRRSARHLSGEIREKVTAALAMGGGMLILTSFLAVGREGLETAVFFWAAAQAAGSTTSPLVGFVAGIAVAVALAYLIYRGAVRINLAKFFTVTGILLIFVAAGILAYGMHDLQEANILPGLNTLAFDISAQIPADSWYGTLLKGIFNLSPRTSVLEAVVWVLYVGVVLTLFLLPGRARATATTSAAA